MSRRRTAGFTITELMVVALVLLILAGIGLPMYQQYRKRATAASVQGAMVALRFAVLSAAEAGGGFPPSAAGTVTPELAPYVPGGFQMTTPVYTLSWLQTDPSAGGTLVMTTMDGTVCQQVFGAYGGASAPPTITGSCAGGGGLIMVAIS